VTGEEDAVPALSGGLENLHDAGHDLLRLRQLGQATRVADVFERLRNVEAEGARRMSILPTTTQG
jgi:hypothetical protein